MLKVLLKVPTQHRWNERQECFDKLSPNLIDTMDLAWQVSSMHGYILFYIFLKTLTGYD